MIFNIPLFDEEKVRKMIDAHKIQFGSTPDQVVLPMPNDIIYLGVKILFHSVPYYYTVEKDHCLHHDWRELK